MTRLTYSPSAYRRSMQMSRVPLFVFIEGYKDRYVYDRIVQSECEQSGVSFKIVTAEEIGINGGGKEVLLKFFDYLADQSSLIGDFKGKTTISIFLLDKDVDDILNTMRSSEHIVYTETYELENYLFVHGALAEVAAALASLETGSMRAALGDYQMWRLRAATTWKEWVELCVFSRICHVESMSNYRLSRSPINNRVCGPVKAAAYAQHLSNLERQSSLPPDRFRRLFAESCRRVSRIYSAGRHDLVFKGKWYTCFLVEDLRRTAAGRRFNRIKLETAVLTGLALTLDFSASWAEHFRAPIRGLIAKAGI